MALVHRRITRDEELLLREGALSLDGLVQDYQDLWRRRRYFHLYKHPHCSDVLSGPLRERFLDFAARLRTELVAAARIEAADVLTHHGYLISSPGAPAQDWHVDYDGELITVYIPLTLETEKNATQYRIERYGYSESVQFLSKSASEIPLICTTRHSMHRGIANDESFRRIVFYFIYSKPDWQNVEPLFENGKRIAVNVDAIDVALGTTFLQEDAAR
jgi:hypothetical protein